MNRFLCFPHVLDCFPSPTSVLYDEIRGWGRYENVCLGYEMSVPRHGSQVSWRGLYEETTCLGEPGEDLVTTFPVVMGAGPFGGVEPSKVSLQGLYLLGCDAGRSSSESKVHVRSLHQLLDTKQTPYK